MNRATRNDPSRRSLLVGALAGLLLAGPVHSQPGPDGLPRVQIRFVGPVGMRVWFQGGDGRFEKDPRIEVPGRINLRPGCVYRLKLGDIPNRPGLNLYPTLEIGRIGQETGAVVAHQAVPIEFTDEDFDQAAEGQLVTKEVRLGRAVLARVRIGNIDLETGR